MGLRKRRSIRTPRSWWRPSIISKRYHETATSFIRATPQKPCGRFFGLGANALYLYCIGKELPLGAFVRRHLNDTFKPRKRDKYTFAYDWPTVGNLANKEGIVRKVCVDLYKNLMPPEAIFLGLKHNSIHECSRQPHSSNLCNCWENYYMSVERMKKYLNNVNPCGGTKLPQKCV